MKIFVFLVSVLIAGTASLTLAQQQIPTKDELLQAYPDLAKIPMFTEFNTSSIKIEDAEKALRDKCEKAGGPTAFDTAKHAPVYMNDCLRSLVNVTQLQTEMDEARPEGNLDEVFAKYCRKVPNLKRCIKNVTDTIEPCLEAEERGGVKIVHNITSSLLEFICHNEGDRIAMFIAAGGIECFKAKQQAVQICANETFNGYVPAGSSGAAGQLPQISSIPLLVLGLKECQDIEKFRTCTVNVLEECTDPTPANVVESLFNFVKRATPCESALKKAEAAASTGSDPVSRNNPSSGTTNAFNVVLITLAMVLSVRYV